MTKRELAQKRNYFKFVLTGLPKPIDKTVLTVEEQSWWETILAARTELLKEFDNRSIIKGLRVPEHKCWCGKPGKYLAPDSTYTCKKHKEDDTI